MRCAGGGAGILSIVGAVRPLQHVVFAGSAFPFDEDSHDEDTYQYFAQGANTQLGILHSLLTMLQADLFVVTGN